ncbi:MAG: hypothetical protein H0U10_02345 [Chloroflexia bacterium]|nr:hypothetical protein [Chloroflexia bacterium]
MELELTGGDRAALEAAAAAERRARVGLLSCAPEPNPAERVFEEVRWQVEGRVYPAFDDKRAAAEALLEEPAADPEHVKRLCGWGGVAAALDALPPSAGARP